MKKNIDIQGHRGCRGLLPENTIPSFIKALDLGVQTLEMDVVISGDGQIVLSHEAYMNHEITTLPDGKYIDKESEKSHNIYKMPYSEVKKYDVGLKPHPRFQQQVKLACVKPLLSEVIDSCESHAQKTGRPLPYYNIEIKRDGDSIFYPDAVRFAKLVVDMVKAKAIGERTTIQSFDHESINKVFELDHQLKTVVLVGDTLDMNHHLSLLNHKPYAYSPNFMLVDSSLVAMCKKKEMKLIPWTVNDESVVEKLFHLGVDGIISDYPNMVVKKIDYLNNIQKR